MPKRVELLDFCFAVVYNCLNVCDREYCSWWRLLSQRLMVLLVCVSLDLSCLALLLQSPCNVSHKDGLTLYSRTNPPSHPAGLVKSACCHFYLLMCLLFMYCNGREFSFHGFYCWTTQTWCPLMYRCILFCLSFLRHLSLTVLLLLASHVYTFSVFLHTLS